MLQDRKLGITIIQFGECVLSRISITKSTAQMEVRWDEGICVVVHDRSGDVRVAAKGGIIQVRDIKIMSGGERW